MKSNWQPSLLVPLNLHYFKHDQIESLQLFASFINTFPFLWVAHEVSFQHIQALVFSNLILISNCKNFICKVQFKVGQRSKESQTHYSIIPIIFFLRWQSDHTDLLSEHTSLLLVLLNHTSGLFCTSLHTRSDVEYRQFLCHSAYLTEIWLCISRKLHYKLTSWRYILSKRLAMLSSNHVTGLKRNWPYKLWNWLASGSKVRYSSIKTNCKHIGFSIHFNELQYQRNTLTYYYHFDSHMA